MRRALRTLSLAAALAVSVAGGATAAARDALKDICLANFGSLEKSEAAILRAGFVFVELPEPDSTFDLFKRFQKEEPDGIWQIMLMSDTEAGTSSREPPLTTQSCIVSAPGRDPAVATEARGLVPQEPVWTNETQTRSRQTFVMPADRLIAVGPSDRTLKSQAFREKGLGFLVVDTAGPRTVVGISWSRIP